MNTILMILLVILLTFSYQIVQFVVKGFTKILRMTHIQIYIIFIWGALLLVATIFLKPNYVYNIPTFSKKIIFVSGIILITNIFISKHSGYKPIGKYNIINFIVVFPFFEEVVFRGIILPLLNTTFSSVVHIEIAYYPVTTAVIISAGLFSIAHLQYYKLNKQSIRFMLFAFTGGILFGIIANETKSILIPLILHIGFNFFATYYFYTYKRE